ncbi:hypothetical protein HDU86_007879 [Geranomyces michiganensis]|nr:hypothetical protein HDU86_007879 [Geranomyces michiganensis]
MFNKSLSFVAVAAIAASSAAAQAPALPAGFPALPAGFPPLPAGAPAIPTLPALPNLPNAIATAIPTAVPTAAIPPPARATQALPSQVVGAPIAASAPAAPAAATNTPAGGASSGRECSSRSLVLELSATSCMQQGFATAVLQPFKSQSEADATFQSIAKCSCAGFAQNEAIAKEYVASCPGTVADSLKKTLDACKANNYALAASTMQLTMTSGGKMWAATPVTGTGASSDASKIATVASVASVASLAGLAAIGFAIVV